MSVTLLIEKVKVKRDNIRISIESNVASRSIGFNPLKVLKITVDVM